MDGNIPLRHPMECACHKRIIFRSIAEYHQFSGAYTLIVFCQFSRFLDGFPHKFYGVHVYTGFS